MKFPNINIPSVFIKSYGKASQFELDLLKAFQELVIALKGLLNGGLTFSDNFNSCPVSATSHATPGVDFAVPHTLKRLPAGYIVVGQEAAGSVYDGATPNTATSLYLKSDVASKQFRLVVF
jgi:hypothetical protein